MPKTFCSQALPFLSRSRREETTVRVLQHYRYTGGHIYKTLSPTTVRETTQGVHGVVMLTNGRVSQFGDLFCLLRILFLGSQK